MLNSLGWLGDSLWVSDPGSRRITLFTLGGRIIREIRWPLRLSGGTDASAGVTTSPRPLTIAGMATGSTFTALVVGLESDLMPIGRLGERDHQPLLVVVAADGTIQSVVGRIPGASCWGSSSQIAGQRLCPVFRVAHSPVGNGYAIAGPSADWPRDEAIVVTRVASDGSEIYRVTIPMPPVPVPASLRDSLASLPRPAGIAVAPGIASHLPPVERAMLDRDGRVWLEFPTGTGGGSRVIVLSRAGEPEAELRFSGRITLWDAAGDRLRGVAYDEDDVPSIVEWRVR